MSAPEPTAFLIGAACLVIVGQALALLFFRQFHRVALHDAVAEGHAAADFASQLYAGQSARFLNLWRDQDRATLAVEFPDWPPFLNACLWSR